MIKLIICFMLLTPNKTKRNIKFIGLKCLSRLTLTVDEIKKTKNNFKSKNCFTIYDNDNWFCDTIPRKLKVKHEPKTWRILINQWMKMCAKKEKKKKKQILGNSLKSNSNQWSKFGDARCAESGSSCLCKIQQQLFRIQMI